MKILYLNILFCYIELLQNLIFLYIYFINIYYDLEKR